VQKSLLTDDHDQPLGRSEDYLVWRIIERVGSPRDFMKHYDEFYSLPEDQMAHLFAFELVRDSEERVLSTRGF
jgi:hypothetical protein